MNPAGTFNSVLTVLFFLAYIPALWIAGRMLPSLIARITSKNLRTLLATPLAKLALWLGLGVIFTGPLLDFLGILNFFNTLVVASASPLATSFGPVPYSLIPLLQLVILVIIYTVTLRTFQGFWSQLGSFTSFERVWITLTLASLVGGLISRTLVFFVQVPIPITTFTSSLGLIGFSLWMVIGLGLIVVVILGLNMLLKEHPIN